MRIIIFVCYRNNLLVLIKGFSAKGYFLLVEILLYNYKMFLFCIF